MYRLMSSIAQVVLCATAGLKGSLMLVSSLAFYCRSCMQSSVGVYATMQEMVAAGEGAAAGIVTGPQTAGTGIGDSTDSCDQYSRGVLVCLLVLQFWPKFCAVVLACLAKCKVRRL